MQAFRVLPRVLRKQAVGRLGASLQPSRHHHYLLAGSPFHAPSPSPVDGMTRDGSNNLYHARTGLHLIHFSSSAPPEPNSGDGKHLTGEQGDDKENEATSEHFSSDDTSSKDTDKSEETDEEGDFSIGDLVKLVKEKNELLRAKNEEINMMKDKVLRSYAEMENVVARTKRDAESSKKFAIQSFAKSLLDVADNLARASLVGKDSLLKFESTETDSTEAVRRLKELLEGVDMTVKQLVEVFKKYGVEQFDPVNEPFDPNMHNAVVQMPDPSKPAGTVSAVLKTGYVLHGRVIRPAEVVVVSQPEEGAEK